MLITSNRLNVFPLQLVVRLPYRRGVQCRFISVDTPTPTFVALTNFMFESNSAPNLGMYDIQSLFAWFIRVRMQFDTHYRST